MYLAAAQVAVTAALLSHHGTVTVRPGDTLSGIAARECGTPAAYPALAAASGIANPDLIWPGQRITLACTGPRAATTAAYTGRHSGDPEPDCDADDGYRGCHHGGYTARHARPAWQATAGTYSYAGLERLWESAGGPAWAAPQAARIAECESGGRASATNPSSGAAGIFQILGLPFSGNPYDPYTNARMAVAKYRSAGNSFSPWVCQ